VIRPSIIVIEFSALADSGQLQRYMHANSAKLLRRMDVLEMFRVYARDAVFVSHAFPFQDPEMENVAQMLPCPN
jgi:hypothetical protein